MVSLITGRVKRSIAAAGVILSVVKNDREVSSDVFYNARVVVRNRPYIREEVSEGSSPI